MGTKEANYTDKYTWSFHLSALPLVPYLCAERLMPVVSRGHHRGKSTSVQRNTGAVKATRLAWATGLYVKISWRTDQTRGNNEPMYAKNRLLKIFNTNRYGNVQQSEIMPYIMIYVLPLHRWAFCIQVRT